MLKILVISDNPPYVRNQISMIFKKIVPILSQKSIVKIFWFSNSENMLKDYKNDYELLFKNDFKNAREVIKKTDPTFIWIMPGNNVVDYSFLITSRFLNIPVFGWGEEMPAFATIVSKKKKIIEGFRQFFESDENNESIIKIRGTTYFKKYLFLIRSLKDIGKNYLEIISEIIIMLKLHSGIVFSKGFKINNRFNCDLIFASNKKNIEHLVTTGFLKNKMKITGNPTWDEAFEKGEFNNVQSIDKKKKILFLTVNLTSGQGESDWSIHRRNKMIKELTLQSKKLKNNISLKIKIHPTSERISEYVQLLKKYNSEIQVFQHEDLDQLIIESDIILTNSSSTAAIIAVIMKKPVIIWNYFHVRDDILLKNNVALECQNMLELENCLKNVQLFTKNNQLKINNFVNNFCGEGNAAKNIVDEIEKFLILKK